MRPTRDQWAMNLAGGSQQVQLTASGLIKILVVAQDRMTIELPERMAAYHGQLEELVANATQLAKENGELRRELAALKRSR